jgi:hypothetical protein
MKTLVVKHADGRIKTYHRDFASDQHSGRNA